MDTFRKWLNKPKADDKSLLARFYHADRSLTAVASELDSFDGRAEPDRCSRLVSRLRQSQDKVLAITNLIMDELLGEDRDARAFRAKFPEEVLQENLAGQLWFGAECLAAGSSIMNREQESKEMRPLAQAVTKSLGNVRNLLRDQCLRNNVPNSRTLHLDHNDTTTEQLCESLKIFDRLFAEFELRYVSAMVQVKTKHEYEMQEMICVLFSETLQRALSIGLLEQDKVDAFDPALMFSIPRLAIIAGLVIYHKGPLNMDMAADQLSEMFRPFRTILIKIRNLLRSLNKNELYQLERLLCTNEEINLNVEVEVGSSKDAAATSDKQNNNGSRITNSSKSTVESTVIIGDDNATLTTTESKQLDNNNTSSATAEQITPRPSSNPSKTFLSSTSTSGDVSGSGVGGEHDIKSVYTALRLAQPSPHSTSVSGDSSAASTPSVSPAASPTPSHSIASTSSAISTSTTSPTDWTDDEDDDAPYTDEHEIGSESPKELDIVSADCASGFLIPNTNFGNLLQPQEVPLTDNFIASEDEFASNHTDVEEDTYDVPLDLPSTSSASLRNRITSSIHTDSSEESEPLTIKASLKSSECSSASAGSGVSKCENDGSCRSSSCINGSSHKPSHHQHHHHHNHYHERRREEVKERSGSSNGSDLNRRHHHHHHSHSHPHRHHHHHHHHHHQHQKHQHSKTKRSNVEEDHTNTITSEDTNTEVTKITNTTTVVGGSTSDWPTGKQTQPSKNEDTSSAESSSSSSLSDGDPHEVSLAIRAAGRLKFKSTENLLHRLFVCIAGVADQLQTNFASDLRQILRSVFLMNMSSAQEEIIDIPEKPKESELFEFRASENDVIQESAGSNQSIYSAEEVNPESDNVFNNVSSGGSAGIQRVNTVDLGSVSQTTVTTNTRNHIGRSRSLGDQENNERTSSRVGDSTNNNNRNLSTYISGRRLSSPPRQSIVQQQPSLRNRNRNNSVGTNSSASSTSSSSSESNSPVSERVAAPVSGYPSVTATNNTSNANSNNNNIENATSTHSSQSQALRLAPPAWIPDEKAPRCMSCHTPFTAFRRRHHCRNCGGVFCGVCSNSSAPLPKYGLTKAVRMCRECYVGEVCGAVSAIRNNVTPHSTATATAASLAPTTTAGGS